ncbi:MAG: nuclear transport factor 2 family protein [Chloroflexota bacterium]|nr:nuclear transport factor 2 family protein [Chloroflexota bacterium]
MMKVLISVCWLACLLSLYAPAVQSQVDLTERTRTLTHQYYEHLSEINPAISEFWADKILLFVNNDGPWGGDFKSRQSVTQYYREMAAMFDLEEGVEFELLQTVVDGAMAAIRFRVKAQHVRGSYENHYMHVLTWNDDGKITRIENFYGWEPFLALQRQAVQQREKGCSN